MHKNVRSSMVKTVFELDASLRNYNGKTKEIGLSCMRASALSGGTSSSWRGFYAVTN